MSKPYITDDMSGFKSTLTSGYSKHFGLYAVDFSRQARTPRAVVATYQRLSRSNAVDGAVTDAELATCLERPDGRAQKGGDYGCTINHKLSFLIIVEGFRFVMRGGVVNHLVGMDDRAPIIIIYKISMHDGDIISKTIMSITTSSKSGCEVLIDRKIWGFNQQNSKQTLTFSIPLY